MITPAQQEHVLDTLYFQYGIVDAYFVSGRLFVVNELDKRGVEKLLESLPFTFPVQLVTEDVYFS